MKLSHRCLRHRRARIRPLRRRRSPSGAVASTLAHSSLLLSPRLPARSPWTSAHDWSTSSKMASMIALSASTLFCARMQCGRAPGAMRCSTSAAYARGPRRASRTSRSTTQCMKIRISAQPRAHGAVPGASRCVRRSRPSIAAGVACAQCPKAPERHTRAGGRVAGHADGTGALRECATRARARHAPQVCRCRASAVSKRRFPSAARSCAANGQRPAPSR